MGLLLLLAACGKPPPPPPMAIEPVAFEDLAGWADDRQDLALASFLLSCAPLLRRDPEARSTRAEPAAGRNADWQALCRQAAATPVEPAAAQAFFETGFQPYRVRGDGQSEGLFTGYFEPLLHGSTRPNGTARIPLQGSTRRYRDRRSRPLLRRPRRAQGPGLVTGDRLGPYPSRGEIERGALDGRDLELLWVDDPIEKFFLQIQGSGLVELDDGRTLRVGYADQNGRAYRAIGRDLIEMGELTKEEVSLQTIEAWLRAHPDRAQEIMDKNPSYVFFRVLGEAEALLGPEGAQGVPLQAERSLAVDRSFIPLGAPLWLDTQAPFPDGERPFRQLVIAQDTGGAIKGAVRGDVFWGAGDLAAFVAGHMKSRGSYYLLLPRTALPVS
ncbi:MAG: MltA domain-containing protein [Geminicoccaceae bacterium]